jgi:UDP-GlcNAc:undecaprenyl-phosphate GlcNAc-1-phosphate transferase
MSVEQPDMLMMAIMGGLMAFLLSLALTPLIRFEARRYGYVVQPRIDRWHRQPTALFGGIAIFVACAVPFVVLHTYDRSVLFLIAGATVVFGLGVVDDLYRIQPYTKLVAQIGAASLTTFGSFIPSSDMSLILILLAIFGLVALTNAFNLLDNMDGLSAGIACIAAFFLFIISFTMQNWMVALCAAILFGATCGFLFYNFNPATIFMGDSGSMFLGFLLGALTMKGNWEQATNLLLMLVTPLLVLAVPIFDTTFVTLVRWMNGRAISVGGRDHTSHRLVALGLSERQAVLFFYLISAVCGFIAVLGVRYNAILPSLLGTLMVIGISYLGMFLNGVVVYGTEGEVARKVPADRGVVLDIFVMHKRRILEVLVDMALMTLAYTASFAVRFDGDIPKDHFAVLARSLPLIIPLKLIVFSSFGLYRGVWRYVGMQDLIAILKAVTVSSLLVIAAMTMLFRFELFPRTVFAIDWMVLLLLVAGVRVLIRAIREYLFSISDTKGRRVVIVGAGDAGELVLRELRNNPRLGCIPIGFFDDDPYKQGRKIHGVPVLGGVDTILETVQRLGIDQIMVAIPSAQAESLAGIISTCEASGLLVTVVPSLADLLQNGLPPGPLRSDPWVSRLPLKEIAREQTWH